MPPRRSKVASKGQGHGHGNAHYHDGEEHLVAPVDDGSRPMIMIGPPQTEMQQHMSLASHAHHQPPPHRQQQHHRSHIDVEEAGGAEQIIDGPTGEEAVEAVLEAAGEVASQQTAMANEGMVAVHPTAMPMSENEMHPHAAELHHAQDAAAMAKLGASGGGGGGSERSRSYLFQLPYCRKYGLRIKENPHGSSEHDLVVCRFCESFGREPLAASETNAEETDDVLKASLKRRKSSPEEFKTNKFYVSNVSAHMHKQHPKKWAEYDALCRTGDENEVNAFFKETQAHDSASPMPRDETQPKASKRNYSFQWQHAIRFGLRARHSPETGLPVAVVCRFCESFGRELPVENSDHPKAHKMKRKRTEVEEFDPHKFYVSNVRVHMNKIHGKKWGEYEKLLAAANDKELQEFFVDVP